MSTITIQKENGKDVVLSEEEFKQMFPVNMEKLMKDRGFGFCSCGMPLVKRKDSENPVCLNGAYCPDYDKNHPKQ